MSEAADVWAAVRRHYGDLARQAQAGAPGCGGGGDCCGGDAVIYPLDQVAEAPALAFQASLGCGNPTALAGLREGEIVLDLGSGGGLDVILAARRVGPRGRVYGLDMTDEMLALARRNASAAGLPNVEFLRGRIEEIPLPDASVDVILSNCVLNLSPDKDRALREAFRVLRPGGRLAVADVLLRDAGPGEPELPAGFRADLALWSGCVAGALTESEYLRILAAAGFTGAAVEDLAAGGACCGGPDAGAVAGRLMSAFVRAAKPGPERAR